MLLPVDLREWLAEDDLVWHVLDVVERLDLSEFYARYRINGQGAAAYDPAMMLALTVYAHAVEVKSSRAIERACTRDAGFKVITGLMVPDHCTISRFVKTHRAAVQGLFGQVLRLCHEAGMVRLGVIAVDGTKIAANASWAKSYTADALAHQVGEEQAAFDALAAQLIGQQVAIDEAEDAEHGPDGGGRRDDLPPHLRRRAERLERIKKAKAQLDQRDAAARQQMLDRQAAKQAAYDARAAAGDRPRGPRPKDEVGYGPPRRRTKDGTIADPPAPRASIIDPDSRRMKAKHGYVQGYNAQTATTADQLIVGLRVSQNPTDHHELPEILDATTDTLHQAGILPAPAGEHPDQQATEPTDEQTEPATPEPATAAVEPDTAAVEPDTAAVERDLASAAGRDDALGVVLADAGYANEDTFTAVEERDLVLLAPLASDEKLQQDTDPAGGQDLTERPATDRGQRRLRTQTGKTLYKIRGRTAEPVFGHLKDRRGLRQFATRGIDNVTTEFSLGCTVHNILKLFTRPAPTPA
jgi:transposase